MQFILRFLLAVLVFVPMLGSAQNTRTLKGVVTDENNAPLAGVSITVKGSRKAVVADAQGRFSITRGLF